MGQVRKVPPNRRRVLSKVVDLAMSGHKLDYSHTYGNWSYIYGTHKDQESGGLITRIFSLFTWHEDKGGDHNYHNPISYQEAILLINRNWKKRSKEPAHWGDYHAKKG